MHTATLLSLVFLLVSTREACGQSSTSVEGDRVTLNATAKSTGPRQSSAHFKNERIKASTVAKVGSVPSSVSPSPVTPSPSVVIASPPPVKPTAPKEPPFPVDFSTTENSLRTYIFQANVEAAAKVLARPQVVSLAAGLTYPEELSPLVEPSGQRNEDPDVVAYKAIALSAIRTGEARKLATAAILSLTPDCQCAVFTSEEQDRLIDQFTEDFENTALMKQIVKADANTDFVSGGAKRRLTVVGGSPVTSTVCASCWPGPRCKPMHWCP